jgi:hypothetical protein
MAITRTTWTDGSTVINNARLQDVYAAIESSWALDTYTPSWTATVSNPVLNNGTSTGKYINLGGKLVIFSAQITMGSSTTYGSGTYMISLPLSADTTFPGLWYAGAHDGGTPYQGTGYLNTSTTVQLQQNGFSAGWSATVPFTFGTSDVLSIFGAYFRS